MPVLAAGDPTEHVWRSRLLACLIGAILTAVLTYPTVRVFGTGGRFDTGDGRFSIWNVAWVAHALIDDPRHLLDANIFHPHPHTLTYSELNLVAGVLATPVYAITRNPVAAHNSAVLVGLWLSFIATWALVRRLTGDSGASIVAAAGYTFSAYTAAHTAEIQLLMIFGFPLVMLTFHLTADRPTPARGAAFGAALAVTGLACGYYGVFAGALAALVTLLWARRQGAYWRALACAVLAVVALVLPIWIVYVRDRAAAGPLRVTTTDELRFYSANWHDYFTSDSVGAAAVLRSLARIGQFIAPHLAAPRVNEVLFPGVVVTALAAVGLAAGGWRRGNGKLLAGYAVIAALACWASLGPDAHLYTVITLLPGSAMLRAPARMGVVVIFALAVLAGFGVHRLGSASRWVGAVCAIALVGELWVPWRLQAMPPPARAYLTLAQVPRGGVVELPFPYVRTNFHEHTKAMVRSMVNWQPLVNGYSDFIPGDFVELALPINGFPDPASFEILRTHGVRYVVVRVSDYGTTEYRRALLARFPPYARYLHLLTDDDDVRLYEIVSWPADDPAASAAGAR
jgi:hypothetical protein